MFFMPYGRSFPRTVYRQMVWISEWLHQALIDANDKCQCTCDKAPCYPIATLAQFLA